MSERHRIVFDASVIVSALLFEHSTPGRAFSAAADRGELLLSREVIDELTEVLGRRKFDRYLTIEERQLFLLTLIRKATLIDVTHEVHVCRDPKDDKYLALSLTAQAHFVVSGDNDLLVLGSFHNSAIISPAQLLDILDESKEAGA